MSQSTQSQKGSVSPRSGPAHEYAVDYGRPPVATRFQPGKSGNPKGRPKKPKTVGRIIQDALMTRVTIEENGRSRRMTAQEVIIRDRKSVV